MIDSGRAAGTRATPSGRPGGTARSADRPCRGRCSGGGWPADANLFRRDIEAQVLPYTAAHDIGVLVYGPLAHGLLGGRMDPETTFAPDDWRSRSPMFKGEAFVRNLDAVTALRRLATEELGVTLPQLAVAWTLAHPAVHAAIVGTRDPSHVEEILASADYCLTDEALRRIDTIMADATTVAGPSPETV